MGIIFKKFLFKWVQNLWSQQYPKHKLVELDTEHVTNCKVLANRTELLKRIPKQLVIAELGVEHGQFSKEIITYCEPSKLFLIDIWPTKEIQEVCRNNVASEAVVSMQKMSSIDFLNSQPANSLDVVYIDTDHTYKTTVLELEAAAKVVKPDGLICGHDYTSIAYAGLRRYGVVEAVNAFCVEHRYEFVYLTSESTRHISFALKKL
jgi:hypothetical protein